MEKVGGDDGGKAGIGGNGYKQTQNVRKSVKNRWKKGLKPQPTRPRIRKSILAKFQGLQGFELDGEIKHIVGGYRRISTNFDIYLVPLVDFTMFWGPIDRNICLYSML